MIVVEGKNYYTFLEGKEETLAKIEQLEQQKQALLEQL